MSRRTGTVALLMACLGLLQLLASAAIWSWPHPKLLMLYASAAVICSFLQLKLHGAGPRLSANLPIILLSILQLSSPEAVLVGASAALAQGLANRQTRIRPWHLVLGVCVAASAIATANFLYRSLVPNAVQSSTLRLIAASLALFFANTFPVALASREQRQRSLGQYWKESYSWLVPYYLVSAAVASAANAAATGGMSLQNIVLVFPAIYLAYRYYHVQKSNLEMREKTAENMAALHLRTIEGLALAVEAKDNLNTRGHLRRVRVYAVGVGRKLGLKGDQLEALQAGALLHDIGKLAVPEYILTKPGKLTAQEFAKMKVHPIVGAEIVEQVQFPYPVAPIVRAHHEKWDGSGYPFGLKGNDIPIGARILSAVDYLDALASDREYRRALPLDEAMTLVAAESGRALDPDVVCALSLCYRELEQSAKSNVEGVTLSKDVNVERGSAPDAGLELWALTGLPSGGSDFVNSIAAAGKEEQMLLDLTQGLGSSLDLDTILERLDKGLRFLIPHDAMAIFVPQGELLTMIYSAGERKALLSSEVRAGEGLIGWVAQNQLPIINGNPSVERGLSGESKNVLKAGLAVPLKGAGVFTGVLAYYRKNSDSFNADHLRILTGLAPRIGTAIENALKVKELQERASLDLLTGLPTLPAMKQTLEVELIRAKGQNQSLAIVIAEFSGLGSLQTELINVEVERWLREASRVLKTGCREYDHVARIGDHKFAMILPGMKRETLRHKLEKLHIAINSLFPQLAETGRIHFGAGWALYPDDADTTKLLLAVAEGRNEMKTGTPTESLLALHSRSAHEMPMAHENPLAFKEE